jgi:hypothetical protein
VRSQKRERRQHSVAVAALIVVLAPANVPAIDLSLNAADMDRALSIARGSIADRSRFHDRYIVHVNGPVFDYVTVQQVEVITEFRRLELIAEDHVRLNDTFGRAGVREPEEALRPWRGRLSIVVRLQFRSADRFITSVPSIVVVLGSPAFVPIDTHSRPIFSESDSGGALIGGTIEGVFAAESAGQSNLPVIVRWNDEQLARLTIDFARLE